MIDALQQRIEVLEKKVGPQSRSPLFAQLASLYLQAKRARDALRLCDSGLEHYPFYTTGHLVRGKALLASNMRAEARREFEFVLDFLPNNETVTSLLAQIPQGKEESIEPIPQTIRPKSVQPEQYIAPAPPQPPQVPEPEPVIEVSKEATVFDAVTQPPPVSETVDVFGINADKSTIEAPTVQEPSPFGDFNIPSQEPAPSFEPPLSTAEQPTEFNLATTTPDAGFPTSLVPPVEETFDIFANRQKVELSGANTISLDDYLNNRQPAQPSMPELPPPISINVQDKIEELTQKLQKVDRITPVINFAQKETTTVSEQDTPAGMGFVTPTLAEIYAKQGWFDDAIKAYRTLARSKPAERERFEKRITELEELKKQQPSG